MRQIIPFVHDWKFTKSRNAQEGENLNVSDGNWQTVRIPHDWAIHGPFDSHHDVQVRTNHVMRGRTGGLPHVGMAWYRRHFRLPEGSAGKRVWVEFDGVMSNSTVYVNGIEVGSWPYGYSSFRFDITDAVDVNGENILSVSVNNLPYASRWYPGAGIYRNVRLVVVDPLHVAHWGTTITTPDVQTDPAVIQVRSELVNDAPGTTTATVTTSILDPAGREVAETTTQHTIEGRFVSLHRHKIADPELWNLDSPALYRVVTTLSRDGKECDRTETTLGIRSIRFDCDNGFFLNERKVRLNGVCLHHDLGALGAAVNRRATERQLELLKEMGCNAIRTAHNPPSPEQLDACDRLGMLVIDEAFDSWEQAKHGQLSNGYNCLFKEWAERDLAALIRRDRNHPCVIMWSIGNETPEQTTPRGAKLAQWMSDICHREDPTRPSTCGYNYGPDAEKNGLCDAVDIVGLNYEHHNYNHYREQHPHWIVYGSETDSCVSSRGVYDNTIFDSGRHQTGSPYVPNCLTDLTEDGKLKPHPKRADLQIHSYDCVGILAPDYEFRAQEECPWSLGQFVWTGFDYLGEPSPYMAEWPSRSSYFGIFDTCGFRKDRYHLYKAQWGGEPVLHLLPHWTWPGREGETFPVMCYTTYPAAELFVNGESQGVRRKNPEDVFERYRLIWREVAYEPGKLKVVALDEDGSIADEKTVETTGEPAAIRATVDRTEIAADGEDLAFVTLEVVDAQGRLCPTADNRLAVEVDGPAELIAMDNGDPTDLEPFQQPNRRAFNGLALAILRSRNDTHGTVTLTVAGEELKPHTAMFSTAGTQQPHQTPAVR